MMDFLAEHFGLIKIGLPYAILIAVCYWQWSKMRREVREMRAEREAREATEKAAEKPEGSD